MVPSYGGVHARISGYRARRLAPGHQPMTNRPLIRERVAKRNWSRLLWLVSRRKECSEITSASENATIVFSISAKAS
jgi:hypothetical protein